MLILCFDISFVKTMAVLSSSVLAVNFPGKTSQLSRFLGLTARADMKFSAAAAFRKYSIRLDS